MTRSQLLLVGVFFVIDFLIGTAITQCAQARNSQVPREFQQIHPCPSTGQREGRCPGWVRDHIIPLCKGGPDTISNMQWQTTADGKLKDRWECSR